jgi:hypothetical protein
MPAWAGARPAYLLKSLSLHSFVCYTRVIYEIKFVLEQGWGIWHYQKGPMSERRPGLFAAQNMSGGDFLRTQDTILIDNEPKIRLLMVPDPVSMLYPFYRSVKDVFAEQTGSRGSLVLLFFDAY